MDTVKDNMQWLLDMHTSKHADALRACLRANGHPGMADSWAANTALLKKALAKNTQKGHELEALFAQTQVIIRLKDDLWRSRATLEAMTSPKCLHSYITFMHDVHVQEIAKRKKIEQNMLHMRKIVAEAKASLANKKAPVKAAKKAHVKAVKKAPVKAVKKAPVKAVKKAA